MRNPLFLNCRLFDLSQNICKGNRSTTPPYIPVSSFAFCVTRKSPVPVNVVRSWCVERQEGDKIFCLLISCHLKGMPTYLHQNYTRRKKSVSGHFTQKHLEIWTTVSWKFLSCRLVTVTLFSGGVCAIGLPFTFSFFLWRLGWLILLLHVFFPFKMFESVYSFEIGLCVRCCLVCIFVKLWFWRFIWNLLLFYNRVALVQYLFICCLLFKLIKIFAQFETSLMSIGDLFNSREKRKLLFNMQSSLKVLCFLCGHSPQHFSSDSLVPRLQLYFAHSSAPQLCCPFTHSWSFD